MMILAALFTGLAIGNLVGWFLRMWWENRHQRYIIVPDLREGEDNTAVMQRAIDLAARKANVFLVRVESEESD